MKMLTLVAAVGLLSGLAAAPAAACFGCGIKFNGVSATGLAPLPSASPKPCTNCGIKFNGTAASGIALAKERTGSFVVQITLPTGEVVVAK